jgi:transposase
MPPTCTICQHPERYDIEANLRGGTSYRDISQRHGVSKDSVARHRANHMSRHTETGLAAGKEIMALLDKAATSPTWNATVLTIREARRYVEQLMELNLTVPSSRRT